METSFGRLATEHSNPSTKNLHELSTIQMVQLMNDLDAQVPLAVARAQTQIAQAVDLAVKSVSQGGRLVYIGAGASGRMAALDAGECPGTFGVTPDTVISVLPKGKAARFCVIDDPEDSDRQAREDLMEISLFKKDLVIALAASGRTPYAVGALLYAKEVGCKTVSIACNENAPLSQYGDVAVEVLTGPELLTGSTRLKAGTAQKLIVNMISTLTMTKLGKVYQNYMVDVKITNEKLLHRALRMIQEITGVCEEQAENYLQQAGGHVKTALVMILGDCSPIQAAKRLKLAQGFVGKAIETHN